MFYSLIDNVYFTVLDLIMGKKPLNFNQKPPDYLNEPKKFVHALQNSRKISKKHTLHLVIDSIMIKLNHFIDNIRYRING